MSQTDAGLDNYCPWCSQPPYNFIVHYGPCPRLKAIEYHPNGDIKRVEFHGEQEAEPVCGGQGMKGPHMKMDFGVKLVYNDYWPKYGVLPDGYNG